MFKPVVNKETIRNHLRYDFWKYILFIAIFAFLCSFSVTVLTPKIPEDQKLDIYFAGQYISEEDMEAVKLQLIPLFPEMKEINVYSVAYEPGSDIEVYAVQKIMVLFGANQGDVFIFRRENFQQYAENGAFADLDAFVEDNQAVFPPNELEACRLALTEREYDFDGNIVSENVLSKPHYFGLPLSVMTGMNVSEYVLNDQVIAITSYSGNAPQALQMLSGFMKKSSQE